MIKHKRNPIADLLKGLAVIFMVQVHIMEQFALPEIYDSIIGKISLFLGGPPCAPVFMGVMGYFLASSERPFSYFLKRGVLLFMGGLLLNIARSANLLHYIINGQSASNPLYFIFGVDILLLAGLGVILIGILQLIFKKNYVYYFSLSLIIAAIGTYLPGFGNGIDWKTFLCSFFWGNAAWSYFPLMPWFAYILLGFGLRLLSGKYSLSSKFTTSHSLVFCIPLLIAAAFTLQYGITIAHDLEGETGYYHHGLLYLLWVLMFGAAYSMALHVTEENYGKLPLLRFIKWIGKNVTAFYVIQWIIIGNFAANIYQTQDTLQLLYWFIGIMAAISLLTLGWGKGIMYYKQKEKK